MPNNGHLRQVMLFFYFQKKKAIVCHRMLVEVYGNDAPHLQTVEKWFRQFKRGDFSLDDKKRSGRPLIFKDDDLQALLDEDPTQTASMLAEQLSVDRSAIGRRLKAMGMIQKLGKWVNEREQEKRKTKGSTESVSTTCVKDEQNV